MSHDPIHVSVRVNGEPRGGHTNFSTEGGRPLNSGGGGFVPFSSDEENGDNIGGPFDKHNMEAPQGVTKTVRRRIEVPKEFLERTLLDGEEVIGQYDYFFTKKRMYLTDCLLYGLYTGGLFFIFYAAFNFYRFFKNIFCCFCWKQHVENKRGKMIVTSNGRVIFWQARVRQEKALDYRAYFNLSYNVHIANIQDLKMMKISFEHKKQGCYYFCSRFEACVELTFYSFNHKDSKRSKFLRTSNANSYIKALKNFIIGKVKGNVLQQEEALVIGITTDARDKAGTPYAVESPLQSLDDIIIMCENIMGQLAEIKDSFLKSSAYLPITRANMHNARFSESTLEAFRSVGPVGVKEFCEDINGTTPLVDEQDENRVNVPIKWLMLAPGEELVAAVGQRYTLNWFEIFLSFATFGVFYFIRLRIKSWQRSAIFITNKRLIEMTVNQHKGRIPTALTGFRAVVRSYFPGGQIHSGYIKGTKTQIISSLQTSAGQITCVLPRNQLAFAHRMQLTTSRTAGIESFESIRAHLPERFQHVKEQDLEGRGRGMLSDTDLALLPTLFEEEIINRFIGGVKFAPCCPSSPNYYLQACGNPRWVDTKPHSFLCHFTGPLSTVRLVLSKCITCFDRPYSRRNDGIVTTHAMYYISSGATAQDPFFLTWVPIKSIKGFSTSVKAKGAHPYQTCDCCCVARKAVVKKGSSRYELDIRTGEGFSLPFSYNVGFLNWLEDENYTKMTAVLGAIDHRHEEI